MRPDASDEDVITVVARLESLHHVEDVLVSEV
jgi:hypothetical protein